ncbi:MAG: hypothetical protein GX592_06930 [Clostridiales bacterium]|nr:hypothetical protein [Clostridiales bacterium]
MDEYRFALKKVAYAKISAEPSKDSALKITDRVEIAKRKPEEVSALFSRRVFFEPEAMFDVCVTYDIVLKVMGGKDISSVSDDDFAHAVLESEVLSAPGSCASLLISEITMMGTGSPIVIPPRPVKKSDA